MKNKLNKLNVKLGQMMVNKELGKKKGSQEVLVGLGLCVVGVFLVMIFKGGAEKMVVELTNSVGDTIKKVFTGL